MADASNGGDTAAQSPQDLASSLLVERFQGDEIATARYLLNAINSLPNATETKRIVLHGGDTNDNSNNDAEEETTPPDAVDIGDILVEKVAVSCTQPRGKLDMTVGSSAILFSKDNDTLFTVQGAVSHCIFFPKPTDCRKRYKIGAKLPQDMVLLVLNEEVTFKKKSYSQLCFQLPTVATSTDDGDASTSWPERLKSILDIGTTERVLLRDNPVFRSYQDDRTSSTTAGLPFVDCYHNVADGCLYLLESGIFFFGSGMRFVPRSTLNSIEAVALNRYATLSVTLDKTDEEDEDDDDEEDDGDRAAAGVQLEFTNIHKDEKEGIQKYIHRTLIPAMKRDAEEDGDADGKQGEDRVDVSRDGEDGDEEDCNDGASTAPDRRGKRKAASEARSINKRAMVSGKKGQEDEDDEDDEDAADQSYDDGDEDSNEEEGGDTESDEGSYEDV